MSSLHAYSVLHSYLVLKTFSNYSISMIFLFREVVNLGEEAHLNTSFKHFIFFVQVKAYYFLNYK